MGTRLDIFEFYEHMCVLDGIFFPLKKKKIPTTKSLTLLCVLLRAQPPSPQTAKRLLEILLEKGVWVRSPKDKPQH